MLCSIAHSIICTRLFRGKMHSDWFKGIEILQGRWQHGEKRWDTVIPADLKKTPCKWDIYVPLVTKGLMRYRTRPARCKPAIVSVLQETGTSLPSFGNCF